MAVVIETTLGDITVDLFVNERPTTCLNFLKLCKMKYYNFNLFHTIQSGFIAQTGDPSGEGTGGQSIFGLVEGPEKRFFSGEKMPKIRHADAGLLSMVSTGESMIGSQFFFTLGPDLDSLDGVHCVIGSVTEGQDILRKLNDVICDETHRPYQDVRITHTIVLEDPFNDPIGMKAPSRSPSPSAERLKGGRIAPDEELDETKGKSTQEIQELIEEKEAKARATILEIVGDLPDADVAPPENVLFVCKLNPVTTDEDLEIIFSRFGKIVGCEVIRDKKTGDSLQYAFIEFDDKKSCEDAYFKMDNVLIDDRRIHVDFSQSVSKMRWLGKGKGIRHFDDNGMDTTKRGGRNDINKNNRTDPRENSRQEHNRNDKQSYYKDNHKSDRRSDKRSKHRDDRHSEFRQERKTDYKQSSESKREKRSDDSKRDRSGERKERRNSPSKGNGTKKEKHHGRHKDRSERNPSSFKDSESKRNDRKTDYTEKRDRNESKYTNDRTVYNEKNAKSPELDNNFKVNNRDNERLDKTKKSNETTSRENGNKNYEKKAESKYKEKKKIENKHNEAKNKKSSQDKKENDTKNNHKKDNKSNHHKHTENEDDKKDSKVTKEGNKLKTGLSTASSQNSKSKPADKSKHKKRGKVAKKAKRESTSSSSSSSSNTSSSDSSSSSSSDDRTKRRLKRKYSTSSSSTSSSSSSSSSSDSSSSDSTSSSDSDEPKKKKKKTAQKSKKK